MTKVILPSPARASRSTFVSVLAWIFIVISAFATCIALMQATMFYFVLPHNAFAIPEAQLHQIPPLMRFMTRHILAFFVPFWTVTVLALVTSIGLLRRRNWARQLFIMLLGGAIVWNLGGLILQQFMFAAFPPAMPHDTFLQGMHMAILIIRIVSALAALAMSVLFVWIIRRLLSASIAAEFVRTSAKEVTSDATPL